MSKITLRNITKYYGKNLILDDISLEVSDGEFLCLTGPSGCGKTTLLRIIAGLDNDHSGRIYFNDKDITELSPSARNVSMVFQDFALYPYMVARDNISFPLRLKKYTGEKISQKLKSTVNKIDAGVKDYLNLFPRELSAGHRQRVATGRAIIREKPAVILMDEPLSNLDIKIKMNTRTYLKKLVTKMETTTIYVTSDSSEAIALADRIAILDNGKFTQVDTPYNIYYHPKNMLVADFFGTMGMNFINGTVKEAKFCSGDFEADLSNYMDRSTLDKLSEEPEIILGIRPEDISFSGAPLKARPKSGSPKVKVDLVQSFPPKANIRCVMGSDIINVICPVKQISGIDQGEYIYLNFNRDRFLLFQPGNGELINPGRKTLDPSNQN
jgi:ABC-type sugar transport system ATPase subunit